MGWVLLPGTPGRSHGICAEIHFHASRVFSRPGAGPSKGHLANGVSARNFFGFKLLSRSIAGLKAVKASMMGRISDIPSELADKHAGVDKTTVSRCLLRGVRLGE